MISFMILKKITLAANLGRIEGPSQHQETVVVVLVKKLRLAWARAVAVDGLKITFEDGANKSCWWIGYKVYSKEWDQGRLLDYQLEHQSVVLPFNENRRKNNSEDTIKSSVLGKLNLRVSQGKVLRKQVGMTFGKTESEDTNF